MKRTTVTFTIGALLLAGTAAVAPTQAAALELGHRAPSVRIPTVHQATPRTVHRATHHTTASADQQITRAILASDYLGAVKPANVAVSQVQFAGADHSWAGALATPKNGQTDPAQVLLQKTGDTWTVRDLGTAGVGCGIAPQTVRDALGLHGPC